MVAAIEREFNERERVLSLAAVISTSFGVGISFGIGFPLTALTFEDWHQPKWIIGLAGAAPAIAVFIALPLLSRLMTKVGAVRAIASGCVIGSIGFLALYMFPSPLAWIGIRLLMSAGFALPWLAGETWINAVAREDMRGRVIAVYAIAFFSGYAVGPLLLRGLGISGFEPFAAAAAITMLSGLPIVLGRRLAPPLHHDGTQSFVWAMQLAPVAMVAAFMGGFAEITNLSLIPNVALAAGWSQDGALGLLTVMTIGGILLQYPLGWLSDKMHRVGLVVCTGFLFILFSLMLPWALGDRVAAFVVMFLIGGMILGFYALGLAIVGERIGASDLAAVNAAYIVMYQAGALVGPIVSGIAMTEKPVHGFVATVVGLTIVSGTLVAVFDRWEQRRARRLSRSDHG
ncbi:MAG: MFS transporter [Proteobacteria bacterium]|nr:MFS transporter [Pseudomonadota bacterium]